MSNLNDLDNFFKTPDPSRANAAPHPPAAPENKPPLKRNPAPQPRPRQRTTPEPEPEPPPSDPSDPGPEPPHEAPRTQHKRSGGVPDLTLDVGLPANPDAEKTILGAVLLDNRDFKQVRALLEPDDFSLDSHRRIALRMSALFGDGKPIDIVTLSAELGQHKELETVGGVSYLASLTEGLPRRPVVEEYIRIVADKSIARRLMTICSQTIAVAADQSETAPQTLLTLEAHLLTLRDRSRMLSKRSASDPFFIGARSFLANAPEMVDWTVEGLIQREGNGLILGDSGTSKSLLVFDLALHLVAGVSWFGHLIPQRRRVALVSREDAPGLSQSRLKRMVDGAPEAVAMFLEGLDLEDWLYVNTRSQRESWTLQNPLDIEDIVEALKERKIELAFFDVFRDLWEGNENDNQETAKVLASAKRISRDANCQVCIVHHLSKSDKGTIFDRARGGGINGWKEWGFGLSVENPDVEPKDVIRKIQFHTKADVSNRPICYRIVGTETTLRLEEAEPPREQYIDYSSKKGKKKDREPEQQKKLYAEE